MFINTFNLEDTTNLQEKWDAVYQLLFFLNQTSTAVRSKNMQHQIKTQQIFYLFVNLSKVHHFLHSPQRDESKHFHIPALANPVNSAKNRFSRVRTMKNFIILLKRSNLSIWPVPVNSLKIICWIPCWIKQYDNIRTNKIES